MLFDRTKKSVASFLCAVLLVSSLSVLSLVSVSAAGANLVTNGDFESGIESWSGTGIGIENGAYKISGEQSLVVPSNSTAYQVIALEKNTWYDFSADFRTTSNPSIHLFVYGGNAIDSSKVLAHKSFNSQTWNSYVLTAAGKFWSGEYESAVVCVDNRDYNNMAVADNISLAASTAPIINTAVQNGAFDNRLDGWLILDGKSNGIIGGEDSYAINGNTLSLMGGAAVSQQVAVESNSVYSFGVSVETLSHGDFYARIYGGCGGDEAALLFEKHLTEITWNNPTVLAGDFETSKYDYVTIVLYNRDLCHGALADDITFVKNESYQINNGIVNPDFEGNTAEGWSGSGLGIWGGSYAIGGECSMAIPAWGNAVQTIKVEPNSIYSFDASIRTTGVGGVYFKVYASTTVLEDNLLAYTVTNCETWDQKIVGTSGAFMTGDNTAVTVEIYNANGNVAIVDDVTVEKTDASINESLVNGDFESGDTSGWIASSETTVVDSTMPAPASEYYINGKTLNLNLGDTVVQYVKVKSNTLYSYRVLARLAPSSYSQSGGLRVRMISGKTDLASKVSKTYNNVISSETNAEVIDGVFTTDGTGYVKLMLQNDNMNAAFVDDIALTEVSDVLVNGGFDNDLACWAPESSGQEGENKAKYDNTVISDGDYAINGKTLQFGHQGAVSQIVKVTPNTVYGFSALGRTGGNPNLYISVLGGADFASELAYSSVNVETWTDAPKSLEGIFNSGDNTYIKIIIANGSATNAAWIDDISFMAQKNESPISLYGTSVLYRLYNNAQGLRFAFEIPDVGESFNMYGNTYTVVSSGTLVGLPESFSDTAANEALTVGSSLAKDCANKHTYIQKDGSIVYTALITDITEEDAYTCFAARAYLVARASDGTNRIFYGDVVESDLGTAYEAMSAEDQALVAEDALIFG